VAARFVDSGVNSNGVRIISSGGVSCGIDASLYVVKLYAGEDVAKAVAQQLDYAWRKTEGFVVL
jgi:transcriptional regulator GlxA family with amidase domain